MTIFAMSGDLRIELPRVAGITETSTVQTGAIGKKGPIQIQKKRFIVPGVSEDTSILRFVSRSVPLSNKGYIPSPLAGLSGTYINEAGRNSQLRTDARDALWILGQSFEQKFGESLVVVSGYRSAAYQQRLWDLGRCSDSLCAPPGYSEHQLGLAVDLFDASTEKEFETNKRYKQYITWLQANAHLYGWTQSYQKGEAIDGYEVEPWHWRYIGIDMATKLHNLGWTYTEYVRFNDRMLGW
jgi:zinc D-Ala-D-Ala carboxypeptidase